MALLFREVGWRDIDWKDSTNGGQVLAAKDEKNLLICRRVVDTYFRNLRVVTEHVRHNEHLKTFYHSSLLHSPRAHSLISAAQDCGLSLR